MLVCFRVLIPEGLQQRSVLLLWPKLWGRTVKSGEEKRGNRVNFAGRDQAGDVKAGKGRREPSCSRGVCKDLTRKGHNSEVWM